MKIDTIVEACNEMFLRNAAAAVDNAAPPSNDEEILPIVKRKRLSEASLCMQNPCQVSCILEILIVLVGGYYWLRRN